MYVPIESMPDTSRVWIYQADRNLTPKDEQFISENLKAFCSQWAAHAVELQSSYDIQYNRFVMLAVNEQATNASGCSIDGSVHTIQMLEKNLQINFFARTDVAFLDNGNVSTFKVSDLKNLFMEGRLNENSISFNTLASDLGMWRKNSKVKAGESWLKRYIPKVPVS